MKYPTFAFVYTPDHHAGKLNRTGAFAFGGNLAVRVHPAWKNQIIFK
jgi:hypothetical protein